MPETVKISQCKFCKRIKEGKSFLDIGKESLSKVLRAELGPRYYVKVKSYEDGFAEAVITSIVDNEKVSFRRKFVLKTSNAVCQRCNRMSAGYYEAVVQLRGNWEKVGRMLEKIRKYVERNGSFVTKVEDVEGGIDIYLENKLVVNEFFREMKGKVKPTRSFRLYGTKKGRTLYRNTYALHL